MGTINIRVHESLQQTLERIRKDVAIAMKKQYNLREIIVAGTVASQIAANKLSGNTLVRYRIKKIGRDKGMIELF